MKRILMICVMVLLMVNSGVSEEYWKKIPYPNDNIYFGNIGDIAVESSGTMWMCEFNKIYTYNNNKWTTFSCDSLNIYIDIIQDIYIDSANRIWFCGQPKEKDHTVAAMYDRDSWKVFNFAVTTADSIPSLIFPIKELSGCSEDKNNVIWFAGQYGVVRLNPDMTWQVYTKENSGLPDNNVERFGGVDDNNVKWFSINGKLVSYNDIEWKTFEKPSIDGNGNKIWSMCVGRNKVCMGLWYETGGAATYDGQTWWHIWGSAGGENRVQDIEVDSNGVFWLLVIHRVAVGDYLKGFVKLDGTNMQWYHSGYEFKDAFSKFCVGPDNRLYFVGNDGINIFSETPLYVADETKPYLISIDSAHPNPFNASTSITFTLPTSSHAELAVYSVTGQRIRTLVSGPMAAGTHTATWDGRDDSGSAVSSGIYISRLAVGNAVTSGKMLLLR